MGVCLDDRPGLRWTCRREGSRQAIAAVGWVITISIGRCTSFPCLRGTETGYNPSPQIIASYFDATPSPKSRSINFTTFLTMFSDHLLSMDPEDELSEAFAAFDETDSGYVPVAQMRVFLSTLGDGMTEEEVGDTSYFR